MGGLQSPSVLYDSEAQSAKNIEYTLRVVEVDLAAVPITSSKEIVSSLIPVL